MAAQAAADRAGNRVGGDRRLSVQERHRVVVDVDDAGVWSACLGDLVHVRAGGQSAADVEELPDACAAQEPDHTG